MGLIPPPDTERKMPLRSRLWLAVRNRVLANLLAGVIFVLPIAITVWLAKTLFVAADKVAWPRFFEQRVPGSGILFALLLLLITGALVRNVAGRRLQVTFEGWLHRVPFIRSIYFASKKFIETVTTTRDKSFRRVVLVEYPRPGIYTLAFVTNENDAMVERVTGKKTLSLFVATTPNPTSGYLIFIPEEECIAVEMKIDDAFRLIISGGVLTAEEVCQKGVPL